MNLNVECSRYVSLVCQRLPYTISLWAIYCLYKTLLTLIVCGSYISLLVGFLYVIYSNHLYLLLFD